MGHVVDVDVVSKDFLGVSVCFEDGSSGESYVGCVWKAVSDFSCCSDFDTSGFFVDSFFQSALSAVCFVSYDDDVSSFRERGVVFLELLHGGEDDAVCFSSEESVSEVFSGFGIFRCLPEEGSAFCELAEELSVQVVSVGYDNKCRVFYGVLDGFGEEYHGEAFSASLGVPEDAAFSVG